MVASSSRQGDNNTTYLLRGDSAPIGGSSTVKVNGKVHRKGDAISGCVSCLTHQDLVHLMFSLGDRDHFVERMTHLLLLLIRLQI